MIFDLKTTAEMKVGTHKCYLKSSIQMSPFDSSIYKKAANILLIISLNFLIK